VVQDVQAGSETGVPVQDIVGDPARLPIVETVVDDVFHIFG
jgi:hypothetical protein